MKNVIKRATLLTKESLISKINLPSELLDSKPKENNIEDTALWNEDYEKKQILNALKACRNNKTKAAYMLKIDRKTLYNKMRIYNID